MKVQPSVVVVASLCAGVFVCSGIARAGVLPSEKNPTKIMQAVNDRFEGERVSSRMQMVVMPSSGRKVTRTLRSLVRKFSDVSKRIMMFESPADERNTGLLVFDYDGAKSDDQWLYLPSIKRSTRISGGDKSGSFMGSDITYADMSEQPVSNFTYKLLKDSTKVGSEDCWLIEVRPKSDAVKTETGYLKREIWVSKSKLMMVQVKAWVASGKKLKLIKFDSFTKVAGIWFAQKIAARTLRGDKPESTTFVLYSGINVGDSSVKDTDFTQRRLEQGL